MGQATPGQLLIEIIRRNDKVDDFTLTDCEGSGEGETAITRSCLFSLDAGETSPT